MNTPSSVPKIIDDDAGEISAVLDGKEIRAWSYRGDVVRIQKMRCAHEFANGWIAAMKHAVDAQIAASRQRRSARQANTLMALALRVRHPEPTDAA